MRALRGSFLFFGAIGILSSGVGCSAAVNDKDIGESDQALANNSKFANAFGQADLFSRTGTIDQNNPFFQNLGINGRTCNSCHKLEDGMGISGSRLNAIFNQTQGLDPVFRINDGSNAPTGFYSNVSTASARRTSFSQLLNFGVIRVGIGVPAGADFQLILTQDPFYFAGANELSLFRRPLPSVNVKANVQLMWDARESEGRPAIRDALINQANDATQGHAERPTPIDTTTRQRIADFQLALFNAQAVSNTVGALNVAACTVNEDGDPCEEARGGAANVSDMIANGSPGGSQGPLPAFAENVNNPFLPLCPDPGTTPANNTSCFKNVSMTFFDPWESDEIPQDSTLNKNRGEIGDGENIFYTKKMFFTTAGGGTEVPGLSDAKPAITTGTCTTCHNTPEFGSHSRKRFFNTGTSDPFVGGPNNRDHNPLAGNLVGFPQYSIAAATNTANYITTTDPGLALRTGRFSDLGKFKVPLLRGLVSRAPYFHNGTAKTLNDVVNFYNTKFGMHMTSEEIRKVVLFLQNT